MDLNNIVFWIVSSAVAVLITIVGYFAKKIISDTEKRMGQVETTHQGLSESFNKIQISMAEISTQLKELLRTLKIVQDDRKEIYQEISRLKDADTRAAVEIERIKAELQMERTRD